MDLLSSGPSRGTVAECTWTMDNIFMPVSSPWIIPKQCSHFNRIPLWLLDCDISTFLYFVSLCLLDNYTARMYNYRLILYFLRMAIFSGFWRQSFWKDVWWCCDVFYLPGWFLPYINGARGLIKCIMWLKQSSPCDHALRVIYRNEWVVKRAQSYAVITLKLTLYDN